MEACVSPAKIYVWGIVIVASDVGVGGFAGGDVFSVSCVAAVFVGSEGVDVVV